MRKKAEGTAVDENTSALSKFAGHFPFSHPDLDLWPQQELHDTFQWSSCSLFIKPMTLTVKRSRADVSALEESSLVFLRSWAIRNTEPEVSYIQLYFMHSCPYMWWRIVFSTRRLTEITTKTLPTRSNNSVSEANFGCKIFQMYTFIKVMSINKYIQYL